MSHGVYHDVTKHSRVRDAQRQLINLSLDVIVIDVAYLGDPVQENDEVRLRGIALGTESTVRSGVIFLYCSLDTVAVPAGPPAERFQGAVSRAISRPTTLTTMTTLITAAPPSVLANAAAP